MLNKLVRADLAAVPAQVKVKPLVWEDDGHGNFRAKSVRGGEGVDRMIEPQVIGDDRVTYEAWGIKDSFDDPASAMSAVEAEISSEILSALEPQPDPACCLGLTATDCADVPSRHCGGSQPDPRDEVIARLVEALRDCDGGLGALGVPRDAEPRSTARAALAAAKAVQHG